MSNSKNRARSEWSQEVLDERIRTEWKKAVTIPIDIKIEAEHQVLNFDKVKNYLVNADRITLVDCGCRLQRGNCDSPLNTCIGLNEIADVYLTAEKYQDRNPRSVTVSEALKKLEETYETGLIHMGYGFGSKQINGLCSCCTCCCIFLTGTLRYGLHKHLLVSDTFTETDSAKCISCGLCVDRCHFGARSLVEGSLIFDVDSCYGCGLCIGVCPENAISLKKK